jgi:hypothetical protein
MHQPQAPQGTLAEREGGEVGEHDAAGITDNDVGNAAGAGDENAYLTSDLGGLLGEEPREFRGNDRVLLDAPPVDPLKMMDLGALQAR